MAEVPAAPAAGRELVAELVSARPRPAAQWQALFAGSWPAFIDADPVAAAHLPAVRAAFGHLQVALTELAPDRPSDDGDQARLVAAAWGVPIRWDGRVADLPSGYSDALARAVADLHAGGASGSAPDALVVCAAQVHPDLARTGAAARVLAHLLDVAAGHGLARVVAPLRPPGKARHPLVPIEEYAAWRRRDGAVRDPWLRTHERMGARVLATTAASQVFTADLAQWRAWTGQALTASGDHVVEGALAPLRVDVEAGAGVLAEPGIWVRHH